MRAGKLVMALLLLQPCGVLLAKDDARYNYRFPVLDRPAQERAKFHQFFPQGRASFKGGVTLPVVGISIEDPFEDTLRKDFHPCTPASCHYKLDVLPAQASQLVLYQVAGVGEFLAPAQWKDVQAAMGPSGIAALRMLGPDGRQALAIYNSSACVGCGLTEAEQYFPEAKKLAQEGDYEVYNGSNVPVSTVRLNETTTAFSYQLPGHYRTHGVAKLHLGDVNFNEMNITLPPADKPLATVILNFYLLTHAQSD